MKSPDAMYHQGKLFAWGDWLGVMRIYPPVKFGPTVQRAVIPVQTSRTVPNWKEFYIASWGCVNESTSFDGRHSDHLIARTVIKSGIERPQYSDTTFLFYTKGHMKMFDVGAPLFDTVTGEVWAIAGEPSFEDDESNIYMDGYFIGAMRHEIIGLINEIGG